MLQRRIFGLDTPLSVGSLLQSQERTVHSSNQNRFTIEAARVAYALEEFDIGHQEVVASLLDCSEECNAIFWGVTGFGAQLQLLNPDSPVEFLVNEINLYQAPLLFISAKYLPLFYQIRPLLINIEAVVVVGDLAGESRHHFFHFDEFIDCEIRNYPWADIEENTPALICYGVDEQGSYRSERYTHRQLILYAQRAMAMDTIQLSATDRILWGAPLYDELAWVVPVAAMMLGCELVLSEPDYLFELLQSCSFHCLFLTEEQYQLLERSRTTMNCLSHPMRIFVGSVARDPFYTETASIKVVFGWGRLMFGELLCRATVGERGHISSTFVFPPSPLLM